MKYSTVKMYKFSICMLCKLSLLIHVVKSNTEKSQENNQMLGLETIHNIKIDKDTKITRNMNLKQKIPETNPENQEKTRDPDWSYSSFPEEVKNHVNEFKRNMSECLKEVQRKDKRTFKRLSPKKESPVHGECLIACVLKRNGVIENGKVHKGNLITLVKKFYAKDEKLLKKLDKQLDRCIESSLHIKDECMIAATLNDCTNGIMEHNKHKITVNY